jgi:hypothetical protein
LPGPKAYKPIYVEAYDPNRCSEYRLNQTRQQTGRAQARPANCPPKYKKTVDTSKNVVLPGGSKSVIGSQGSGDGTPPPTPNWKRPTPAPPLSFTEKPKNRKRPNENEPAAKLAKVGHIATMNLFTGVVIDLEKDNAANLVTSRPPTESACLTREGNHIEFPGSSMIIRQQAAKEIVLSSSSSEASCDDGTRPSTIIYVPPMRRNIDVTENFIFPHFPLPPVEQHFQGLLWGDGIEQPAWNTCPMDSFFSHVMYLNRVDPNFRRYFNLLPPSTGETIVNEMIRRFPVTPITEPNQPNQPNRRALANWSNRVHHAVGRANSDLLTPYPMEPRGQNMVTDFAEPSRGGANWFQLFQNSSRFYVGHACGCRDTETQLPLDAFHSEQSASNLVSLNTRNPNLSTSLANKRCKTCQKNFQVERGFVLYSSWFIRFAVTRDQQNFPEHLRLTNINSLRILDYELGFRQYRTRRRPGRVAHVTSVHRVLNTTSYEWNEMYYDSMLNNGRLMPVPANLDEDHELEYVYYFRKIII